MILHLCYWFFMCRTSNWFIYSSLLFSEETVAKEKIWSLISQNEPSLVPISLVAIHRPFDVRDIQSKYFCGYLTLKFVTQASKLSTEDCMACVDLLEVLLVEHLRRFALWMLQTINIILVLVVFLKKFIVAYFLFILQSIGDIFSQITITGKPVSSTTWMYFLARNFITYSLLIWCS